MRGLVWWYAVAIVMVAFVLAVRVGPIHEAAWSDACKTLRNGGSIEGSWYTVNHCNDLDPRRAR